MQGATCHMWKKDMTIYPVWEYLDNTYKNFEKNLDPLYKKQTGSYYTSLDLAYYMIDELINNLSSSERNNIYDKKFLEPCAGVGNFVFAYLRICKNYTLTQKQKEILLNNIYVCDCNQYALETYKKSLIIVAKKWFNVDLTDNYFKTHIGSALLFDVTSQQINYFSLNNAFNNALPFFRFDIIITNPPYKNLKAENTHYKNIIQKETDKQKYVIISQKAKKILNYSTYGTLNLYKLFTEEIIEKYLADDGICSLLIPSSILSDKSCEKLRTRILESCSIRSLRIINENNSYVTGSQALCAMLFHKGTHTSKFIINNKYNDKENEINVTLNDIADSSTGNALLILSEKEYYIRNIMKSHPKIKDIPYIKNLRGELDLTINKNSIQYHETAYPLIRGRNIGFYTNQKHQPHLNEYVSDEFVKNSTKQQYIFTCRLACQQIVNMLKKRRVSFSIIPENYVLANSCNFISVLPNNDEIDIYYLLGILNSSLIDWFFKLSSSNNHVNNYEIDNFPIPIAYTNKTKLAQLVKEYCKTNNQELLVQIEEMVSEAYGITNNNKTVLKEMNSQNNNSKASFLVNAFYKDLISVIPDITIQDNTAILNNTLSVQELFLINYNNLNKFQKNVIECIEKKYKYLNQGIILNHTTFKLSELDLEMISSIPQGGNWKNIPQETINKSKRLIKITQTGGRTTLYGRIDYSKPSYTITTYFNRPGNGTYVHPIHNRVLSVREAARFQTFPDDYYFHGNKTDLLKQVGNAVPVLLAYCIAKLIKDKIGCTTCVDLFSGAGGMTYGFKQAGIKTIIANDIEESACITLKTNCPEIPVLCGDITDREIKNTVISEGIKHEAEIVCGGPPCQGYSLAGLRKNDDSRNSLFKDFIEIVAEIKPKVVVFENVEGLFSYLGGTIYTNIINLFSELEYYAEGQKLLASHYGIPQRRKRIIIICVRKDLGIMPSELFPIKITPSEHKQITAYDTIFDLENVACSEHATYKRNFSSPIIQYFKKEITPEEYFSLIREGSNESKSIHYDCMEQLSLLPAE